MSVFTKIAQSTETPDTGQGGTAFDSINTTSGSTSISVTNNGSQTDTARWFNFDQSNLGLPILSIRLKFDWTVGGTLDVEVAESGAASASYAFNIDGASSSNSINVSGPGPVSDHLNISDGGSVDLNLTGTAISSIEVNANLNGTVSSSGSGTSNASPTCSITNIKLEITLLDGKVIVLT